LFGVFATALRAELDAGGRMFLYASGEGRHVFVNLSLTLSSAFLLLKDLRRKRLSGRLTPLQPAPTLDKYEEKNPFATPSSRRRPSRSGRAPALICEAKTYLTDFCASQ
jgi:hypothetical protein